MKFGVADYGMMVWDGGLFDVEERLAGLRQVGYEGIERLRATSPGEAVHIASRYRRLGMDFATVQGPDADTSMRWTAAFGKPYMWTAVNGKDWDTFIRQVNLQAAVCRKWGIKAAIHNHLGTLVETQEELERFLKACPLCGLILDTAHLAAIGGDPVEIVHKFPDRLTVIHLKDWIEQDSSIGWDEWYKRGRFCELGAGNIGLDNLAVMKALEQVGYNGWIFVEHDTHLQDPFSDLLISREYLRKAGY